MKIISKAFGGYLQTSFVPFSPVETATPERTAATDKESSSEKEDSKKSMIEQIFDPKMNMLASDAHVLAKLAGSVGQMESSDYFGQLPRAKQWATIYQMYITKANQAKNNYENLTKAKDHMISSGAAQEVAITSEGYIFIHKNGSKEISLITPEQFNRGKDIAVTNAELMYLRANDKNYAFNDKLSQTIMGSTSLKEIRDIIKSALDYAKQTTDNSIEYFINPHEAAKTQEGLKALAEMNISPEDLKTMDLGTLIKKRVETKSNKGAVKSAIEAIYNQLTPQQIALLKIRSKEIGGEADPSSVILEYANAVLKHEKSISLNIENTYTSGNAEARAAKANTNKQKNEDESKIRQQKMPPSVEFLVGYGKVDRHRFSDGSRGSLFVEGNEMPLTTEGGKNMGFMNLNGLANSSFAGGLDLYNITVGGELIDLLKSDYVLLHGNKLVNAALPIDQQKLSEGIVTPDIDATKRLDAAWRTLKSQGITGKNQQEIDIINKTLEAYNLPAIFVGLDGLGNPIVNLTYYKRFAIANGYIDGAALPDEGKFSVSLTPLEGNLASAAVKEFKSHSKNYKGNDRGGWFSSEPDIYSGTIFIPIKDNVINAYAGSGVNLTTSQAELLTRAEEDTRQRREQPKTKQPDKIKIGQY